MLEFDKDNKLVSKTAFHKSLIPVNISKPGMEGAVHTHLPGYSSYMTATDICTILLYQNFAKWKQSMVVSEKYMSIWNFDKSSLPIVPYRN
ncbi:MAG: hypothetical protein C4308_03655 [Chitinophagaceae bacterium]